MNVFLVRDVCVIEVVLSAARSAGVQWESRRRTYSAIRCLPYAAGMKDIAMSQTTITVEILGGMCARQCVEVVVGGWRQGSKAQPDGRPASQPGGHQLELAGASRDGGGIWWCRRRRTMVLRRLLKLDHHTTLCGGG